MVKNMRLDRPIAVPISLLDAQKEGDITPSSITLYCYLCFLSRGDLEVCDFEYIDSSDSVIEALSKLLGSPNGSIREGLLELREAGYIETENLNSDYAGCVTVYNTPEENPEPKFTPDGFVYLAYCETGHYKIGRSKNPSDRIKHFDTQMPVEVSTIHTFPAETYRLAEEQLQSECSQFHEKGEWYDLPPDYVDAIKRIEKHKDDFYYHDGNKVISIKDLL